MGGPLSVIFSDMYMTKTECEIVNPSKPKFYKCLMDDIISRRNKNQPDDLFQKLNSHHPNIKHTVKVKPEICQTYISVYFGCMFFCATCWFPRCMVGQAHEHAPNFWNPGNNKSTVLLFTQRGYVKTVDTIVKTAIQNQYFPPLRASWFIKPKSNMTSNNSCILNIPSTYLPIQSQQ